MDANCLLHHWQVPQASVIISISGGAQDFQLPPRLHKAFAHGLAKAAQATGASVPATRNRQLHVYKLQATSYELQATSYKLQATSYKRQATSYERRATSYELPATSSKLR